MATSPNGGTRTSHPSAASFVNQPPPTVEEVPTIEVTNEFTTILVRRVRTHNGVRLRIGSPKTGTWVDLDALILESLTKQTVSTLSRFLATSADQGALD